MSSVKRFFNLLFIVQLICFVRSQTCCDRDANVCLGMAAYCNYPGTSWEGVPIKMYCMKTCGTCSTGVIPQPNYACNDLFTSCPEFPGYCNSNSYISGIPIRQACPRTCGMCAGQGPMPNWNGGCRDMLSICPSYAIYCNTPNSMVEGYPIRTACPFTCGACYYK